MSELLLRISHDLKPAMLLVSHDIRIMAMMADELAVMRNGRIIERGSTERILSLPQNEYTKELVGTSEPS